MSSGGRVRGGWSRTALPVTPEMFVVDIGSGAFPNPRADLLCERDFIDDRHRGGNAVVIDRPMVRCDALALPFRDKSIDFVIASHIAEHVDEPGRFCAELERVAKAGYVETPSPLYERLFDEEFHDWLVGHEGTELQFRRKTPRPRWLEVLTSPLYRLYYAGQTRGERRVYTLPEGKLGSAIGFALRAVFGAINRTGVLYTRVVFRPGQPLRGRVL